ncbi:S41 family peptidase [Candidatus Contubernalis alkaliaceticus]|uniref:S41 family peptidase n=1 Tax=Candidatus Contubernalis alkaliaceticus TaxID=338645 RepID=UPI001F4C46D1|nr:S41 family peptidase [Candidatus Contubernalis alkalaceticus]UNC90777.1 S41 family peptidase [Candidatus Contubernalis alkalaceticus]
MRDKKIMIALLCMLVFVSNIATYHFTSKHFSGQDSALLEELLPGEEEVQAERDNSYPEELELFLKVYQSLISRYIEKVPPEQLLKGAIQGMVGSLGDPQTYFLDEEELENIHIKISGSFSGIGIEVSVVNDRITVIAPIKGSPGEKVGLVSGDQILAVDGESLEGVSLVEAISRIRGPENTQVNLTIKREGFSEFFEFEVKRENIVLDTVSSKILEGDIGYIQVTNFDEHTGYNFKYELEKLEDEDIQGLILDLRNNPGGVLQGAVELGELLVPQGPITFMVNSEGEVIRSYYSSARAKEYEIVVLVNAYSASASEIIAGALQDTDAAVLVGVNTYGKSTVQTIENFYGEDVGLRLTVAKYLTPEHRDIHSVGLEPDIYVELPEIFNYYRFPFTRELSFGNYGDDVKIFQKMLEGLGYNFEMEGYFDEKTVENLKVFQKANNLGPSGILESTTLRVLYEKVEKELAGLDTQLNTAIEYIQGLAETVPEP